MKVKARDLFLAAWIQNYNTEFGYSPSVRDVMEGLDLKSPSSAHAAIERVETLGFVQISPVARRAITVDMHKVMEVSRESLG